MVYASGAETIRIHHTLMWQINSYNEWGKNYSRRGSAESGILLFPMSCRYWATTIKVWWILCLVHQLTQLKVHTMDMLWEKFQWILPLYMKAISFQSKASVVCSVTAAIFTNFCLKKLNVFSQHIGKKTNEYLNSSEQIPRNWNFLC